MRNGINFAKVIAVLAIVFGVSLGLCGLTAFVSSTTGGAGMSLLPFGLIELAGMVLSLAGIVAMLLAWGIARVMGGGSSTDSGLQKLFEDEERDGKPK